METKDRTTKPKPHDWRYHACGRTCATCMLTQATGEYDDDIDCRSA